MMIRWNPTRDLVAWPLELTSAQREMNKLINNFFHSNNDENGVAAAWTPAVDVIENDNEYIVRVELPGVNKNDLKITLESNVLTIAGEKKAEEEVKREDYHRIERTYGSLQRSFTLPTMVNADKIDTLFQDGILRVTLPKAEEARPRQIEVNVK